MLSVIFLALLGVENSTNIVLASESQTSKAWERKVVMVNDLNSVINDDGKVAEAADVAAIDETASISTEISESARVSMTNALSVLTHAAENAATDSIGFFLAMPPQTSRTNLCAYVVKTESDGTNDHQWVWFNRQMGIEPKRYVEYKSSTDRALVACEWVNWTNVVAVTVGGVRWDGCHECRISRPSFARDISCVDMPNDQFGGENGFDFGDMVVTVNNVQAYTGVITNSLSGAVLYFDNGFLKGGEDHE